MFHVGLPSVQYPLIVTIKSSFDTMLVYETLINFNLA